MDRWATPIWRGTALALLAANLGVMLAGGGPPRVAAEERPEAPKVVASTSAHAEPLTVYAGAQLWDYGVEGLEIAAGNRFKLEDTLSVLQRWGGLGFELAGVQPIDSVDHQYALLYFKRPTVAPKAGQK